MHKEFNIHKKYLFILINFIILLSSCKENRRYIEINPRSECKDSIRLFRTDSIIKLNIGNRIHPLPVRTQVLTSKEESTRYYIFDEGKIYEFNLESDSITRIINLNKLSKFSDYSGFTINNEDSIFAYSYNNKTLYLCNSEGSVIRYFPLEKLSGTLSPEAIYTSPILITHSRAILSGVPMSNKAIMKQEDPISVSLSLDNEEYILGGSFPEPYRRGFWGGLYYNTIHHDKDDEGHIVYSFPVSNYIYRYNNQLEFVDSLYMGSRYTDSISATNNDPLSLLKDKDHRLQYFLEQDSYGPIIYDQYRRVYYRIAEHPLKKNNDDCTRKPFSIIVMDTNGKIITETPIIKDYKQLFIGNIHVIPEGIIIQKETTDENVIEFIIYRLS